MPGKTPNCGGLAYPPVFSRDTEYREMRGGSRRHRRTRRGRAKMNFSRRMRAHGRRKARRTVSFRRRRMRGGYAADTLLPQPLVNMGRSVITSSGNLAHKYMGNPVTPSPYPTSQTELRPMVEVHFPEPPQLEQIALSAAQSAGKA